MNIGTANNILQDCENASKYLEIACNTSETAL